MLFCGRFSGFKANISGPACLVAALIARLPGWAIFSFSWPADLRPADHEKEKISGSWRCGVPPLQHCGTLLLTRFGEAKAVMLFLAGRRPARGGAVRRSAQLFLPALRAGPWRGGPPVRRSAGRSVRDRAGSLPTPALHQPQRPPVRPSMLPQPLRDPVHPGRAAAGAFSQVNTNFY